MRRMKDSGIKWIGEIPEGWEIIKLCYISERIFLGKTPEYSELPNSNLTIGQKNNQAYGIELCGIKYSTDKHASACAESEYLKHGDILLNSLGTGSVGRVGYFDVTDGKFLTDGHIIVIRPKEDICGKYVFYFFSTLRKKLEDDAVGSTNQAFLTIPKIYKIALPFVAKKEQRCIASFLDTKCSRLDAVIKQTRTSIEEYKKLKQSVITEAVTKGIRPGRKMKASGVEWISEIPDEWSMVRGKGLFTEVDKRSEDGSEELLTVSQYTGVTPRSQKNVNMFEAETLEGYKICENGDIAANTMWLWAGAIGVSKYRGVISPSYNIYRQKDNVFDSTYLDYLLRATPLVQHYESLSTGIRASRLRLYPQQFLGIRYPVPPIEEQKEIVNYLKQKTGGMEVLIQKKEEYLSEIESYKKSLIFEYVTGKKEVSF